MNKSRRTFIKQGSILLAGVGLAPSFAMPSSPSHTKLAIQLFGLDGLMSQDPEGTLQTLKAIGYDYIEHSSYVNRTFYGFSPADFKSMVTDNGLTLLSGHTVLQPEHWNAGKKTFTPEWRQVLEDACSAGQQFVISPWIDQSLWDKEKEFRSFLDVMNKSGELCRKLGLQFGYHNHDFEFTHHLGNKSLYDIILKNTDPLLVKHQLDIGNMNSELVSIEALIKQYPGRYQLMHVKNVFRSTQRHQLYSCKPLGDGILDVSKIISLACKIGGTENIIVDQFYDIEYDMHKMVKSDYQLLKTGSKIFPSLA